MTVLAREQRDAFWRDGYLMVEDAVTPLELEALRAEIGTWVEESRDHEGRIVRGEEARFVRLKPGLVELSKQLKSVSFFTVLGQDSKAAQ